MRAGLTGLWVCAAMVLSGCGAVDDTRRACGSDERPTAARVTRPAPRTVERSVVGWVDRMSVLDDRTEPPTSSDEDASVRITRERLRTRKALLRAIDAVARQVAAMEAEAANVRPALRDDALQDVRVARAWEQRLVGDLRAVDRVGDVVWSALMDEVDKDLKAVRAPVDRPSCVGPSCENAYDL